MIKKLIFSILLGCTVTLFIIQDEQWFKEIIGKGFAHLFQQALDCTILYKVKDVHFFSPELVLQEVTVRPNKNEPWEWKAQEYITRFSWWQFLTSGKIGMKVELKNLKVTSEIVNNKLAMLPHIQKIIKGPQIGIPTPLKQSVFKDAEFIIHEPTTNLVCTVCLHSEAKKFNNILKSSIYIQNGSLAYHNDVLLKGMSGTIQSDVLTNLGGKISRLQCGLTIELPQLADQILCFFSGSFEHNQGRFKLQSSDGTLCIDPITINTADQKNIAACKASIPLSYVAQILNNNQYNITGDGSLAVLANLSDMQQGIHGHLFVNNASAGSQPLAKQIKLSFSRKLKQWKGALFINNDQYECDGSWAWNERTKRGKLEINNSSQIELPGSLFCVMAQDAALSILLDNKKLCGTYNFVGTNRKLGTTFPISGSFEGTTEQVIINGVISDGNFQSEATITPSFCLRNFYYRDNENNQLVTVKTSEVKNNEFTGTIMFPLIKNIFSDVFHYYVQGEGTFVVTGSIDDNNLFTLVELVNGTIRLPQTYNFINGFNMSSNFNWDQKKLVINELLCRMYRGKITCNRASLFLDDTWHPYYAQARFLFDKCLLNVQKDLFTIVSGMVSLQKPVDRNPCIHGNIILERSQLKENLFSESFQKKLFGSTGTVPTRLIEGFGMQKTDFGCNITIETKDPIRVKTSVLETNAKLNLKIYRTLDDPGVSGSVLLTTGSLAFPYKPLFITKGNILFMPGQTYDPIIELVAKNKIKKYNVTMYVTGSLQQPHIMLESAPPLNEEQIISLLLVGCHEESLNVMMPALVMQNIQNMLFNSAQSPFGQNRFGRLFKPFKHINLLPSFSNQTGRGGLRGAIEITIGDRWRALIQKNFSLTEDTRFEFEYLLSDDISLRGFRNERRDVGGEIEMRWKI